MGRMARNCGYIYGQNLFCYEKTPDSYKISNEFSYDEDGLDQAYNWGL